MNNTYKVHTEETGKSMAMRLLIHYVGDIHQPLHASSRVNNDYPAGDRGGNSFKLPSASLGELHAVWDSVMFEFQGYSKLPFSKADWNTNGENAARLMDTYPMDHSVISDLNPSRWAMDSFELTKSVVYTGVKEGEEVSQEYKDKGLTISEEQVVIGGNRLANLLMSLGLTAETKFLQ